MQCKSYSHFVSKNIRILYIESAKIVNEMTLNELVKLTTLWTTGPRSFKKLCEGYWWGLIEQYLLVCPRYLDTCCFQVCSCSHCSQRPFLLIQNLLLIVRLTIKYERFCKKPKHECREEAYSALIHHKKSDKIFHSYFTIYLNIKRTYSIQQGRPSFIFFIYLFIYLFIFRFRKTLQEKTDKWQTRSDVRKRIFRHHAKIQISLHICEVSSKSFTCRTLHLCKQYEIFTPYTNAKKHRYGWILCCDTEWKIDIQNGRKAILSH